MVGGPRVVPSELVHTLLVRGLCLGPNATHRRPDKVSCPCRWTGNASRSGLPWMVQAVFWMQSQRAEQLLGQGPVLASPMQGGGCGLSRAGLAGQCHRAQRSELVPSGERTRCLNSETGNCSQRGHPPAVLESAGSRALQPQLTESGLRSPCSPVSGSPHESLGYEHIWVTMLGLCSARAVSSASMSDEPVVLTGCSCPAGG